MCKGYYLLNKHKYCKEDILNSKKRSHCEPPGEANPGEAKRNPNTHKQKIKNSCYNLKDNIKK